MKTIAFETANSYIKVFNTEKEEVLIYPNTVRETGFADFVNNSTTYEIDGKSYNAGLSKDFHSSSSKGFSRYSRQSFYVETIIALAHEVEDGDTITAATGLPASHYTKKLVSQLQETFEKTHVVKVDGKEVSFTIEKLQVLLQPLGSYFFATFDEDGSPRKHFDKMTSSNILIVDMGFGSTDLAEISVGQLKDYEEVGIAMVDAYSDLFRAMKRKYEGRTLETATILPLELEIATRDAATFEYSNEKYPIAELRERVFTEKAEKILDTIQNMKDLSEFDQVIFTGGGTLALGDYMPNILDANAVKLNNAQEANVRGFAHYSAYLQNQAKKKK